MRPKAQNPSTKIQKNHDTSAPTAVIFCAVRVIFLPLAAAFGMFKKQGRL